MLSSTSSICLALAGSYVSLYYCPLSNPISSTHCCRFLLRVSLRWSYSLFLCLFLVLYSNTRQCMQIVVYFSQFLILGKVLVLSHVLCVIHDIHHYAQLASFKRLRVYCVRKKADIL